MPVGNFVSLQFDVDFINFGRFRASAKRIGVGKSGIKYVCCIL